MAEALAAITGPSGVCVPTQDKFPIVGIGASAGGIEALEGFFRGVPANPDAAFVVITHLNPDRESFLHEIISRYTKMAVSTVADGVPLSRNHVYVMPPDVLLGVRDGRLQIKKRPTGRAHEFKPVDVFLSALAADHPALSSPMPTVIRKTSTASLLPFCSLLPLSWLNNR